MKIFHLQAAVGPKFWLIRDESDVGPVYLSVFRYLDSVSAYSDLDNRYDKRYSDLLIKLEILEKNLEDGAIPAGKRKQAKQRLMHMPELRDRIERCEKMRALLGRARTGKITAITLFLGKRKDNPGEQWTICRFENLHPDTEKGRRDEDAAGSERITGDVAGPTQATDLTQATQSSGSFGSSTSE